MWQHCVAIMLLNFRFARSLTRPTFSIVFAILLLLNTAVSDAVELSGNIAVQQRAFLQNPLDPRQHNNYTSISAEPEWYFEFEEGKQSITFRPFYRKDQYDEERTHGDIRELSWQKVFENWELKAGVSKVYWGVIESLHLVDIINQTDQIENVDGEDKLGQPMIQFSTEQDWGILDIFILPGFRKRTYAGIEGRPRLGLLVDTDAAVYESSDEEDNIDYAIRWLAIFDEWELGLSHFSGTGREPENFVPIAGQPGVFAPFYAQIDQTGLDVQALIDEWTLKLELISRDSSAERFTALAGGFEYTIVGISEAGADLGIVIEYLYDNRRQQFFAPFQNDLTTAFRVTLNDIQSTEILLGVITDLDHQAVATFVEASRRIGENFRAELEIRTFSNTQPGKPLNGFRKDDFIQAELAWYF